MIDGKFMHYYGMLLSSLSRKFMHYYGMLLSSLSRTRTYTGGRRGVKLSNHKKLKMQNIVKNVIDLRVM